MPCDDCSRADDCPPCVNEECSHEAWEENGGWCTCTDCGHGWPAAPEPPGSAMDELCSCGHARHLHRGGWCRRCPMGECVQFVPAAGETAGEPEVIPCGDCKYHLLNACKAFERCVLAAGRAALEREETEPEAAGCPPACAEAHTYSGNCLQRATFAYPKEPEAPDCWACKHAEHRAFSCTEQRDGDDCHCACGAHAPTAAQEAAMDELTHLRQEMEADEPECPCGTGGVGDYEGPQRDCPIHGEPEAPECLGVYCDQEERCRCAPAQPPRRPPYAVAYAIEGGAQYEIALPGDATIRAEAGALIITHASAVLALTQARPMES